MRVGVIAFSLAGRSGLGSCHVGSSLAGRGRRWCGAWCSRHAPVQPTPCFPGFPKPGHWGIEALHRLRDVTSAGDTSQGRRKGAPALRGSGRRRRPWWDTRTVHGKRYPVEMGECVNTCPLNEGMAAKRHKSCRPRSTCRLAGRPSFHLDSSVRRPSPAQSAGRRHSYVAKRGAHCPLTPEGPIKGGSRDHWRDRSREAQGVEKSLWIVPDKHQELPEAIARRGRSEGRNQCDLPIEWPPGAGPGPSRTPGRRRRRRRCRRCR
jgi:hypothetical protein